MPIMGCMDITTLDNGSNGNARFTAYGSKTKLIGYGATKREAKADLNRKLREQAAAMVGCSCSHEGEEGVIEAVAEMASPMLAVRFGARTAILYASEIGAIGATKPATTGEVSDGQILDLLSRVADSTDTHMAHVAENCRIALGEKRAPRGYSRSEARARCAEIIRSASTGSAA